LTYTGIKKFRYGGFGHVPHNPAKGRNRKRSKIMPIARIDTLCECDGCGKRFGIELDITYSPSEFDSFEELVKETVTECFAFCYSWAIRGKETVERFPLDYSVTIQAEMLLCDECSRKCDEFDVVGELTLDQVLEAIEKEPESEDLDMFDP